MNAKTRWNVYPSFKIVMYGYNMYGNLQLNIELMLIFVALTIIMDKEEFFFSFSVVRLLETASHLPLANLDREQYMNFS